MRTDDPAVAEALRIAFEQGVREGRAQALAEALEAIWAQRGSFDDWLEAPSEFAERIRSLGADD